MGRNARLASRLAVCQILGTLSGVASAVALSPIWHHFPPPDSFTGSPLFDFVGMVLFGLAFGIPFYGLALFVLRSAAVSILRHPFIWCIIIPATLLAVALVAFPPARVGGIYWIAVIPLSALFSGIIFYFWQLWHPVPI
jgi:hypothetical protein